MIVTASAPLRISLLGGGTDVEPFASQFGGIVINFTINLRQHVTLYTDKDTKMFQESLFPDKSQPKFLTDLLKEFKIMPPYIIHSSCDAHLGSGLGSSAAAAVALLCAIKKLKGMNLSLPMIANSAWDAETHMGWYGGKQDQYATTYGGWNVMEFGSDVRVNPLARGFVEPLKDSMVLFYTGERKIKQPQEKFREPTKKQIYALNQIKELAVGSLDYIVKGDSQKLGGLLDLAWQQKKDSNQNVSNPQIDTIYQHAKDAGAFGGKVCGSGSGGYMFFMVDPQQRKSFLQHMARTGLTEVDFDFDFQGAEARIL